MRTKNIIGIALLGGAFMACQNKDDQINNMGWNHKDSIKVINKALGSIIASKDIPEVFGQQLLQIIRTGEVSLDSTINIPGQKYVLLPASTDVKKIINGSTQTVPLVEISSFKMKKDSIQLKIILRGNGKLFEVELKPDQKNSFKVSSISNFDI